MSEQKDDVVNFFKTVGGVLGQTGHEMIEGIRGNRPFGQSGGSPVQVNAIKQLEANIKGLNQVVFVQHQAVTRLFKALGLQMLSIEQLIQVGSTAAQTAAAARLSKSLFQGNAAPPQDEGVLSPDFQTALNQVLDGWIHAQIQARAQSATTPTMQVVTDKPKPASA